MFSVVSLRTGTVWLFPLTCSHCFRRIGVMCGVPGCALIMEDVTTIKIGLVIR